MKSKIPEYLPLHWCKQMLERFEQLTSGPERQLGITGLDTKSLDSEYFLEKTAEMSCHINASKGSMEDMIEAYLRNTPSSALNSVMDYFCTETRPLKKMPGQTNREAMLGYLTDCMTDFDTSAVIRLWAENKQVFKFDTDFTNELVNTTNIQIVKDQFKYLPYSTFYVDISDNKDLCKTIVGDGFFISVRLYKDRWYLHICKVTDDTYFTDLFSVPNGTEEIEDLIGQKTVPVYRAEANSQMLTTKDVVLDYALYQTLVLQILMYLSSANSDISENAETKRTYRKPTSSPKHKFSEIQKWDVGVRFGEAIRTWNKQKSEGKGSGSGAERKEGSARRPHTRRAHWHRFWYGKHGGERELRLKWVNETFVNVQSSNDLTTVIHEK